MNLKENLKKELEWLVKKYPLKILKVNLIVYSSDNDSYICDNVYRKSEDVAIFVSYNEKNELTETNKITLKKIKRKELLPYWYLYHEYGHLIELDNIIEKYGYEKAEEWISGHIQKMNEIKNRNNNIAKTYKELKTEKNADLFAFKVYMNRVKELNVF